MATIMWGGRSALRGLHGLTGAALAFGGVLAAACSSSVDEVAAPRHDAGAAAPGEVDGEVAGPSTARPPDACGPVPKSKCTPANEGSVIRGIVKFDASKLEVGSRRPRLRVFLHHQVLFREDEAKMGGHPHAWKSYPVDTNRGEAPFSLDLCEFGVAMYSEENCGFNLVAVIDDDGGNDPDTGGLTAFVPRAGKPAKMVPLDVSCHAPSSCLEIEADCTDGEPCTTFAGLKACSTCAANGCASDDKLCAR